MQLRLLFIFLTITASLSAQDYRDTLVQNGDTTIIIDYAKLPDDLPSFNILSPQQAKELRETQGIFPVRIVDQLNTYRWNDNGAKGATVSNEHDEEVVVIRYINAKFKIDTYCLGFKSSRGKFPPNYIDIGAYRNLPKN